MGSDDRGIVDQSTLRMRAATFSAGVWLSYVVCTSGAVYAALTWGRANRTALLALFAIGIAGAVCVSALPRERIVRSRWREPFFLCWSLLDLALIVLGTLADGGTGSPLALMFFIPVVFAAMSYPLASVLAVGALTVASYLALALTTGGATWGYQALFAVTLTCTGAMSAWQARNHGRQRSTLMAVSLADPLTGCLNRRGFEARAVAEISAAARNKRWGAVLLLDIDHFKQVNDRHGHAAGDEVLRSVVHTLRQTVRPNDAIGRVGGDEFAVLLADIDPTDALESGARVAQALHASVPCSIGLASFPIDGGTLEELMSQADGRLYATRRLRRRGVSAGIEQQSSGGGIAKPSLAW